MLMRQSAENTERKSELHGRIVLMIRKILFAEENWLRKRSEDEVKAERCLDPEDEKKNGVICLRCDRKGSEFKPLYLRSGIVLPDETQVASYIRINLVRSIFVIPARYGNS